MEKTCPLCYRKLRPAYRQSIKISVCSRCRGFWMEAGQMDLIIRRYKHLVSDSHGTTGNGPSAGTDKNQSLSIFN